MGSHLESKVEEGAATGLLARWVLRTPYPQGVQDLQVTSRVPPASCDMPGTSRARACLQSRGMGSALEFSGFFQILEKLFYSGTSGAGGLGGAHVECMESGSTLSLEKFKTLTELDLSAHLFVFEVQLTQSLSIFDHLHAAAIPNNFSDKRPQSGSAPHARTWAHHIPAFIPSFPHLLPFVSHRPPMPPLFPGVLGTPSAGEGMGDGRGRDWPIKALSALRTPVKASGRQELGSQAWGPTPAFP